MNNTQKDGAATLMGWIAIAATVAFVSGIFFAGVWFEWALNH